MGSVVGHSQSQRARAGVCRAIAHELSQLGKVVAQLLKFRNGQIAPPPEPIRFFPSKPLHVFDPPVSLRRVRDTISRSCLARTSSLLGGASRCSKVGM